MELNSQNNIDKSLLLTKKIIGYVFLIITFLNIVIGDKVFFSKITDVPNIFYIILIIIPLLLYIVNTNIKVGINNIKKIEGFYNEEKLVLILFFFSYLLSYFLMLDNSDWALISTLLTIFTLFSTVITSIMTIISGTMILINQLKNK
ncbi:MAG: hypothetical protein WC933_03375 [Candidatus Paceibacterota bacterium]|jgi:hypothetical protein